MRKIENIKVNGYEFHIGYANDDECAAPIFEMKRGYKFYGVRIVNDKNRELGWQSGLIATDAEVAAIAEARKILNAKYHIA